MTQQIYGGTLTFNASRHNYAWNGTPVPGCTTILKRISKGDNLVQWSANMAVQHIEDGWHPDIDAGEMARLLVDAKKAWVTARNDAADIGKEVHAYAEAVLKGEPRPKLSTEEAIQGAAAFEEWLRENKVTPIAVERRLMSKTWWFCGTTDLVAKINGEMAICDFKTSSGIYLEYALQLAAYRLAWCEEHGEMDVQRWVVRTDKKTGDFEARRFKRDDLHERTFLSVLELHRQMIELEATPETAFPPRKPKKKAA